MATALKKLNEITARLLQVQSYTASIGFVSSDSQWALATPTILNGNAILIEPGPSATQIVLKASSLIMNIPLNGPLNIAIQSDTPISSSLTIPPGARTDGTYYYFSSLTTYGETPVLLANKYSHIYIVYDVTKPGLSAIGVIASTSATDPGSSPLSNLGTTVSARQAVCYVDGTGNVTLLQTFPGIFNSVASVPQDSAPSFADWHGNVVSVQTNTITVQFTFPAGTGTGAVGELAVLLGTDIIAFLPISPQLLKDSDVPLVLNWTIMIGDPGAFLS